MSKDVKAIYTQIIRAGNIIGKVYPMPNGDCKVHVIRPNSLQSIPAIYFLRKNTWVDYNA